MAGGNTTDHIPLNTRGMTVFETKHALKHPEPKGMKIKMTPSKLKTILQVLASPLAKESRTTPLSKKQIFEFPASPEGRDD